MNEHTTSSLMKRQSILIIGAAGRLGLECIKCLSKHSSCPEIHAFCKESSNLSEQGRSRCSSIIEGSARYAIDIEEALRYTKAGWVILCVGTGENINPSDVRTFAGQNVARVLQKTHFLHVRVLAISMSCSSQFNRFRLRWVLSDHKGQEDALKVLGKRVLIVRCTQFAPQNMEDVLDLDSSSRSCSFSIRSVSSSSSSNSVTTSTQTSPPESPVTATKRISWFRKSEVSGKKDGLATKIVEFGDNEHAPSHSTNRTDLAEWITNHLCHHSRSSVDRTPSESKQLPLQVLVGGSVRVVNLTSVGETSSI